MKPVLPDHQAMWLRMPGGERINTTTLRENIQVEHETRTTKVMYKIHERCNDCKWEEPARDWLYTAADVPSAVDAQTTYDKGSRTFNRTYTKSDCPKCHPRDTIAEYQTELSRRQAEAEKKAAEGRENKKPAPIQVDAPLDAMDYWHEPATPRANPPRLFSAARRSARKKKPQLAVRKSTQGRAFI